MKKHLFIQTESHTHAHTVCSMSVLFARVAHILFTEFEKAIIAETDETILYKSSTGRTSTRHWAYQSVRSVSTDAS